MPKLISATPKYGRHKASGQAVVTLDGQCFYLGPHGSRVSKREYDRLVAEWLANGRRLPSSEPNAGLTITEVIAAYWVRCERHYRKPDGEATSELDCVRLALRPLKQMYGDTRAADFGPMAMKAVRQHMMNRDVSRGVVNSHIGRIKRMFRWAVENELVPPTVLQALMAVAGLQRGRCDARETEPVRPIDDSTVDATIKHMAPIPAAMLRFQRLTGARPMEVCLLRPADVDRSGDVWSYRPRSHKTQHHGRERIIFIGPKAQEILLPFLLRDAENFCFVPAEAELRRQAERRERRQTPMTPSQAKRKRKSNPKRTPGERYSSNSYRHAINKACNLAFPAPDGLTPDELKKWRRDHQWSPNRLRHTAATEIRKQFGLEAAQALLGHASADITQIYAERDQALAARIMREVG